MELSVHDPVHDLKLEMIVVLEWHKHKAKGQAPSGRADFSITLHGNIMVLFGGGTLWTDGHVRNDLHVLDYKTFTWMPSPHCTGTSPSPRQSHRAVTLPTKSLMGLFGGTNGVDNFSDFYILDTESWIWSQPSATGEVPSPRSSHSQVIIGNRMFVYGGTSWVNFVAEVQDSTHVYVPS